MGGGGPHPGRAIGPHHARDTCSALSGRQTASDHCWASVSLSEAAVRRQKLLRSQRRSGELADGRRMACKLTPPPPTPPKKEEKNLVWTKCKVFFADGKSADAGNKIWRCRQGRCQLSLVVIAKSARSETRWADLQRGQEDLQLRECVGVFLCVCVCGGEGGEVHRPR